MRQEGERVTGTYAMPNQSAPATITGVLRDARLTFEYVFGEERVQVEPRLPDALEAAITLAEEEGEFAGGGVLVTGSVITVGEARLLLGRG